MNTKVKQIKCFVSKDNRGLSFNKKYHMITIKIINKTLINLINSTMRILD